MERTRKKAEQSLSKDRKLVSLILPQAIKYGLGLIPEGRKLQSLFLKFSVKENISIVGFRKALNRFGLLNSRRELEMTKKYSERLKIKTPSMDQKIINLSGRKPAEGSNCQMAVKSSEDPVFGRAYTGIDIGAKNEIYAIIEELAEQGVSVYRGIQ